MTRCNLHGGANPSAKIKAEQMLAQARIPACEALFEIIESWSRDTCQTCHHPSGDTDRVRSIIRACQVILDRTGMGPHSVIELTKQTDGDIDLRLLTPEENEKLVRHLHGIKAIKETIRTRQAGTGAESFAVVSSGSDMTH